MCITLAAKKICMNPEVTHIVRSHLDLVQQEKLIPAYIDLKLIMIPNTGAYRLKTIVPEHAHPHVNYKFKIMEARLVIRNKHISISLILRQERVLHTKEYLLNHVQYDDYSNSNYH